MPIATCLTAVVLASSLAGAAPITASLPPIVVDVTVASNVPASLVTRVLEETAAVWTATGLTFMWRQHRAGGSVPESGPPVRHALDVVIGNDHGVAADLERENKVPLGWIRFDGGDVPTGEIYLSYENAVAFMVEARGVVGAVERMTLMERELKLARAMGRALAHEIGHYLLASKVHTPAGLMEAAHSAVEFFSYPRDAFAITAAQRQTIANRLVTEPLVASR